MFFDRVLRLDLDSAEKRALRETYHYVDRSTGRLVEQRLIENVPMLFTGLPLFHMMCGHLEGDEPRAFAVTRNKASASILLDNSVSLVQQQPMLAKCLKVTASGISRPGHNGKFAVSVNEADGMPPAVLYLYSRRFSQPDISVYSWGAVN